MNKMILIIGIIVVVVIGAAFVFVNNNANLGDEQAMVSQYLKDNISEISPEKEVLGGKFYITSVVFDTERVFSVEYEDGHIALKARGEYEIDGDSVKIKSFNIIK